MDHCILQIAAGALTLQERISLRHQIRFIPTDQARYEKYLETWRSKMGPEHPERLRSRLSFEGLGENDLPELLGKPVFDGPEDLPEWIFLFTEIEEFLQLFDFKANAGRVGEVFVSGLAEQVPFLCLTLPFAEFAMNRVRENTGDILIKRFSSEALRMLHSEIAQTLAMSLAHTLQLEFSVFRASRQSPLERLFLQSMPGNGKEDTHYQQFWQEG